MCMYVCVCACACANSSCFHLAFVVCFCRSTGAVTAMEVIPAAVKKKMSKVREEAAVLNDSGAKTRPRPKLSFEREIKPDPKRRQLEEVER